MAYTGGQWYAQQYQDAVMQLAQQKGSALKNLVWNNTRPKNESVEDTLNDVAGYAIIGLMLRKGWFELPMKED